MMDTEILKLADDLGEKYLTQSGFVNIDKIVEEFEIPVLNYHHESKSPATIVCKNQKFYIFLNQNPEASSDAGRTRFSLAHELGHYFITKHKNELLKGNTLVAGEVFDQGIVSLMEKEADAFAAKLLLPTKGVKKFIDSSEITLDLIERVSDRFKVSTEAAALNLIQLSETDQVLIKWRHKKNNYKSLSNSLFKKLRQIQKHRIEISSAKLSEVITALSNKPKYTVENTVLADWLEPISIHDFSAKFKAEAKLNEGFGGMILLTAV